MALLEPSPPLLHHIPVRLQGLSLPGKPVFERLTIHLQRPLSNARKAHSLASLHLHRRHRLNPQDREMRRPNRTSVRLIRAQLRKVPSNLALNQYRSPLVSSETPRLNSLNDLPQMLIPLTTHHSNYNKAL